MKFIVSLVAVFLVVSCGKKIENRSQNPAKRTTKTAQTASETWSIFSERPLPAKISVFLNDMEFVNECTGLGNATVERTERNGNIHIQSYAAFRSEYFDVDIFNCQNYDPFFSADYVDQQIIDHPVDAPIRIILRLRND